MVHVVVQTARNILLLSLKILIFKILNSSRPDQTASSGRQCQPKGWNSCQITNVQSLITFAIDISWYFFSNVYSLAPSYAHVYAIMDGRDWWQDKGRVVGRVLNTMGYSRSFVCFFLNLLWRGFQVYGHSNLREKSNKNNIGYFGEEKWAMIKISD